jgi:predicted GIY-YIG superfamily endonuclease
MVYIYALKLQNNKYYIGKTNNPSFRLEEHFKTNGCAWTKKYSPIQLLELIPNCDDYDEDKYTRKYMDKYGIENVRGGSFVTIELDSSTIEYLSKMSDGTNNRCFKCGEEGHFANSCKKKVKYEYVEVVVWCCDYCHKEFNSEFSCNKHEKTCDKNNEKCKCSTSYFSPHRKNKCLLNKLFEESSSEDEYDEDTNCCYRCGRHGHYANECYARNDINGNYLKKY